MKLHAPKHLVLTLMVAAALALATAALADKTWKQIPNPDEIVFDEQFTFDGGPELSVEVDDLDIVLVEGSGGSARVQVEIKSRNRDKAQEYFDELRFRARMEGGELIVETRRPKVTIAWGWNKWNGIHARAVITVPKGTDMRLLTSDGDLSGEDIEGNVDARTGDGDITFASVKGDDVSIKASDGDVRIGGIVSNNIHIASADGDLTLGELKAPTIALKTSDGDVRVDGIEGDDMTVRSADGDVTIDAAGGKLSARTSDGDITIGIASRLELELSTSDGDVYLQASKQLAASLDLRGDRVSINGRHDFEGDMSSHRVKGKLGGGGPLIVARTSDGDVSLDLR